MLTLATVSCAVKDQSYGGSSRNDSVSVSEFRETNSYAALDNTSKTERQQNRGRKSLSDGRDGVGMVK